jgi:hypothetical protein
MRMFFIGRICDLVDEGSEISFYPINLWIIAYTRYDGSVTSYIGHIKNIDTRFHMPQQYEFRGLLTRRFIFGGYRYVEDHNPDVPSITFYQDEEDHTLTVTSVDSADILWDDLRIETDGYIIGIADDGDGIVESGEYIFSLYGLVEIYHEPTDVLLGSWIFSLPPL